MATKINWAAVGPSIQALLIGAGVIASAVTVMQKQDALAIETSKDIAALSQRVDKLYDLLVYPQVVMRDRQ